MKIEQLQYIVEIDEFRSITKASEHMYRTQPTVSHAVNTLENELNIKIFNRTRSGTEPTDVGRIIIDKSKIILNLINEIYEISKNEKFNYSGTSSIASIPGICTSLLPKAMDIYKTLFPKIKAKVVEGGSFFVKKSISMNQSNLGLISVNDISKVDQNYQFIPLFKSNIVLVSNKDSIFVGKNPISLSEIGDTPIVLYNEEYSIHNLILNMLRQYMEPNIYLTSRNFHSLKKIVLQGLAISFTSEIVVKEDPYVKSGELIITDIKEDTSNTFGILYSKKTPLNFYEEEFIKIIVNLSKDISLNEK